MSLNASTRCIRILVAEDDETDFFFLQHLLKNAGIAAVYRVSDGEQALEYLEGKARFSDRSVHPFPDILLLDLKLPKVSGHEILEWLQRQSGLPTMKVCVLSSSSANTDRTRAARAGAHDYFVKPLSLAHLAALLTGLEATVSSQ